MGLIVFVAIMTITLCCMGEIAWKVIGNSGGEGGGGGL